MEVLSRLFGNAQRIRREMSSTQRVAIYMTGITVMVSLSLMAFIGSTGKTSHTMVLPPHVAPDKYQEYAELLKGAGVDPKYIMSSQRIEVPEEQVDQAMMLLAENKLLGKDAYIGFNEMIERVNYTTSNPHRKTMMVVARQNELERMITSIDAIKSANVILTTDEDKLLYGRQRIRPRAAVKVTTALGRDLTQDVADTIIHLVASSTQQMMPESVVVVDQHGQNFRSRDGNSNAERAGTRKKLEELESQKIRSRVEELCRASYPNVEAFAFVDLALDMDEREKEAYEVTPGQPLRIRGEKMNRESIKKEPAVTGVTPNTARSANLGGGGGAQTTDVMTRKTSDTTNENGKTITRTKFAPGDRKRLSVSVVLQLPYENELDPKTNQPVIDEVTMLPKRKAAPALSDSEVTSLILGIQKSTGVESVRDIELRQVEWKPPLDGFERAATVADVLKEFLMKNGVALVMAFLVLVVLLVLRGQIMRALPAEEIMPDLVASLSSRDSGEDEGDPNSNFEILREKVADIISEDPKKAANVLRRWMVSE